VNHSVLEDSSELSHVCRNSRGLCGRLAEDKMGGSKLAGGHRGLNF
jgi:hypothetical protein